MAMQIKIGWRGGGGPGEARMLGQGQGSALPVLGWLQAVVKGKRHVPRGKGRGVKGGGVAISIVALGTTGSGGAWVVQHGIVRSVCTWRLGRLTRS